MKKQKKEELAALRYAGQSYEVISEKLGISMSALKSYCSRNGLTDKDIRAGTTCPNCGTRIKQIQGRKKKRFCSDRCRYAWWNSHLDIVNRKANYDFTCACCGKPFTAYGNKNRKYCSRACYMSERFGNGNAAHV